MKQVLIQLRCMNLFYHDCHNNTTGISFVGDHELFKDFYEGLETDYDDLVERFLGLGEMEKIKSFEIIDTLKELLNKLSDVSEKNVFMVSLHLEENLRSMLQEIDKTATIGTRNLIGTIADKSEVRSYKLKQRNKGV